MKISFDKVGQSKKEFNLKLNNFIFNGYLIKDNYDKVKLNSHLKGVLELNCNRCGIEYSKSIDLPISLTLTNRIIKHQEDLDIIEFLDGIIDLEFIVQSEISSIKSEYHYCNRCSNSSGIFEKEF